MKQDLDAKTLRERLHYDLCTGVFTWKVRASKRVNAGDVAGTLGPWGYIQIRLFGSAYKAHRLAWLYVCGEWPAEEIDHINGCRTDNKIKNLRSVTKSENQRNAKLRKDNKSGVQGVFWEKHIGKWRAYIRVNGKPFHLGCFNDLGDAAAARKKADGEFGFHPNHGRLSA